MSCSQTSRATNCATPRCVIYLIFLLTIDGLRSPFRRLRLDLLSFWQKTMLFRQRFRTAVDFSHTFKCVNCEAPSPSGRTTAPHPESFFVVKFGRVFHYTKISLKCQERRAKILRKIFCGSIAHSSFTKPKKTIDFTFII